MAVTLSVATLIVSLVPTVRVLGTASESETSLSFAEYFAGLAINEERCSCSSAFAGAVGYRHAVTRI